MAGGAFSRGHLYRMLQNPIYVGQIAHKGQVYDGQHPAIVARDVWDRVQLQLAGSGYDHKVKGRARQPNLLSDLLVDEDGAKLTCTHAVKDGKRYRYYVRAARPDEGRARAWRLPAHEVEALVIRELREFLTDQHQLTSALLAWSPTLDQLEQAFAAAERFAERFGEAAQSARQVLLTLVRRIRIGDDKLVLELCVSALIAPTTLGKREHGAIEVRVGARLTRDRLSSRIIRAADSAGLATEPLSSGNRARTCLVRGAGDRSRPNGCRDC